MKKLKRSHNIYPSMTSLKSGGSKSKSSSEKPSWVEENILKLECNTFVSRSNGNCACGRNIEKHQLTSNFKEKAANEERMWSISRHTTPFPTDAYGTVEFQGGPHPYKARYVRIHYQTTPTDMLHLLLREWNLRVPNLVISIIGGLANFELQPKLKKVFSEGLVKAAKTTGAWVITTGLDTGVTKHVGEALKNEIHVKGSNIVALGISPWGIVQHRNHLVGREKTCPYYSIGNKNKNQAVLNQHHNYFLLADNGMVDKFGAEIVLRRSLEQYLATQPIRMRNHGRMGKSRVPVVAVLVEGGMQAFRLVFELVTDQYPVPVVVVEGSGRAADLLAFMHRYSDEEGDLPSTVRDQILKTVQRTFSLDKKETELLYKEMKLCLKRRELITIYRMEDNLCPDIDVAILAALLQDSGPKLTKADQLTLTMAWNRSDIARTQIFETHSYWQPYVLESSMVDALINDRLDFVKLLLENGVNMHTFLKVSKLEYFYNVRCCKGDVSFVSLLKKVLNLKKRQPVLLRHVGALIELLMGSGYQHHYCRRIWMQKSLLANADICDTTSSVDLMRNNMTPSIVESGEAIVDTSQYFRYPFTELLQWALLTRRYDMAMYMVISGEESIAKSLMSVKLLRGVRKQFDIDNESEYLDELKSWENKFEQLAVDLQDHCYKHNPEETKRLLSYELQQFSGHTCISLAYLCQSKPFLSHVCTQNILNDLWYGGLREGKWVGLKVLVILMSMVAIIPALPISFIALKSNRLIEFKTKQELALQPQTLEEYLADSSSDSSSDSTSSDESTTEDVDYHSKSKPDETKFTMREGKFDSNYDYPYSINQNQGGKVLKTTSLHQETIYNEYYGASRKENSLAKSDPTLNQDYYSSQPSHHVVINIDDSYLQNDADCLPDNHLNQDFYLHPNNNNYLNMNSSRASNTEEKIQRKGKKKNKKLQRSNSANNAIRIDEKKFKNLENFHISPTVPTFSYLQPGTKCNEMLSNRPSVSFNNPSFSKYLPEATLDYSPDNTEISPGTQLSYKKKIYEFFFAPITKFYMNVIAYMLFMILLIRLAVIPWTLDTIDYFEMYVYIHICTNFLDQIRKVVSNTPGINIPQRIKVHFESFWNVFDFGLGLYCIVAIIVRYISIYKHAMMNQHVGNTTLYQPDDLKNLFLWGRNLIILSSGGWIIKSLELMKNWRLFGAYIEMIRCMSKQLAPLILILSVIMTSFGTIRQGIMYHSLADTSFGNILKNIYLKPYFMLYGEVYAPEIDPVDFPVESRDSPLAWTVPLMMVIFMLSAVVVILSLIIAGITDIYGRVKESSVKVYMYLRYPMIIDYENKPFAPPPFIIVIWIYRIFKSISFICCSYKERHNRGNLFQTSEKKNDREHSAGLKLFLSKNKIEELHDFEEECVEDYWREMKSHQSLEPNIVMKRTLHSLDQTHFQMGELHSRFNIMRVNLQHTNNNLNDINMGYNYQNDALLNMINQINNKLDILYINSGTENISRKAFSKHSDSLAQYPLKSHSTFKNISKTQSLEISSGDRNIVDAKHLKYSCPDIVEYDDLSRKVLEEFDESNVMIDLQNPANDAERIRNTQTIWKKIPSFYLSNKNSLPLRKDYTTICDEIIISDWGSYRDSPKASPTQSVIDLSQQEHTKKPHRHMKSKAKKNKRLNQRDKHLPDKEEHLRNAEKIEREEMASVMVQRLRQLSYRKDDSSVEENLTEVVQEITDSENLKNSDIPESDTYLSEYADSKSYLRINSSPLAKRNSLVIFHLSGDDT